MKKVFLSFLVLLVAILSVAVVGCSDGKLNLLLVLRNDREDEENDPWTYNPPEPGSSTSQTVSSPSNEGSSSSEGEAPIGSSSSYSSISSSSFDGDRGIRSSTSKTDSEGNTYVDYPDLEDENDGVKFAITTRYWDGCKAHCSRPEHVTGTNPWAICRNCDVDDNEMPTYFKHPNSGDYWSEYYGTPSGCDPHDMDLWVNSPTLADWQLKHPTYQVSPAYTCWDMAPHVVNDTLAYLFAASASNRCGKCFLLQFTGEDSYDVDRPRDTHRAVKGKNVIVMVNNTGVGEDHFDLMMPGGGLGDFDAFSGQIGVEVSDLGATFGGFLTSCTEESGSYYTVGTMEYLQDCVRQKCNDIFWTKAKVKSKTLLDGCLFTADWLMAAANPRARYKEVECPQYLVDKYRSKIDTEPPPSASYQ